ncbi:MAG TPA: DEAD/DEAH box helicase [Cyanobacteria bacterium UBA11149]|nr:DEAD/DEAH box helicase [Cyanobacteria bacterium UBA11367]HBE60557.1 DEAD/DEAH box helicase [Cyanobacteria bacterium UBA11366]HBK63787.1 DEAD/DEAH box helicase [Cyanobacteria bacterium UBA11166]HBR72893.1 DEAD/DEAH box helicase [Cyanobacteria bacterium UBA11159]HBS69006.1 DEAD/DEAH box helicase [Cyanobacteria bacterium UBA11153]HBW89589.1 DEAD/DEAH box helicase [Cyanobacteria bacterium UBA11149]HCA93396.1 DEAD/DEAH box helicase [Cyanobacteria bacterium UBA9226]
MKKLTHLPNLSNWLANTTQKSRDKKYYHRQLTENLAIRTAILQELQQLVHQAHEDARQNLRNLSGIDQSLDFLQEKETLGIETTIFDNFPRYLELKTLKGYFGEIMAAVVAEHFNPLDEDWQVFAFPFRLHQTAYHALEKVRQEGGAASTIIGRLGDDMLAFHCNDQGKIIRVLFCEAKCTARHDINLIAEAHQKSSDSKKIPVDCLSLINILKDYAISGSDEEKWIHALRKLYFSNNNPTHERCDLVLYICGLPPVKASTIIIPTDTPHKDYTAQRRLEAVEIHLHDVNGLVEEAYQVLTQPIVSTLSETELSNIWDKVIFHIPTQHQEFIKGNCRLLVFDSNTAVISVNLLQNFRDVQRKTSIIQKAFEDSGNFTSSEAQKKIDVRLKVEYTRASIDEEDQMPVERHTIQPDEETVALASQLVESLVGDGLPPTLARLYSHHTRLRENQPGLTSWSQAEANSRLEDVMKLIEAASIQRQADDNNWKKTVLRAGEILEWLPISDIDSDEISTRLLSAACYQLAGYPARALGLLREERSLNDESGILIALLKADFVGLGQQISKYWSRTISEIQDSSPSDIQDPRPIETMIVKETVSALGVLSATMRWGSDSRIQKALDKLAAVSKVVLHGRNSYSWILSKLCAEVAATYVENSMRQHLDILLQDMNSDGRSIFERYLRQGFCSGKSMAWPSQISGIQALSTQESFALCTPTASGKTTVAELAILQSLFPTNGSAEQPSLQAPLVIYLVPSRALATEVEAKLSRVLRQSTLPHQQITVTGLYGGTDWGPTDAWLTADEKTVLICTYEKAEALMKFIGSFFLPRTTLIVVDEAHAVQFTETKESLQKSENRSLRLESLGARLFSYLREDRCRIIALSAVAARAESTIARWITRQDNATPITTFYKSTRQLIGRLECLSGRRFEIRYDLLDNSSLEFSRTEREDSPYIPNPFPPHPTASSFERQKFTKKVRPYVFWAAMHLAAPDDRGQQRAVLISISQGISGYANDFLELLNKTWSSVSQRPVFFEEPSDDRKKSIWEKCLLSCEDYYTTNSREYKLLTKGVVVHHGKMPGLMARLLVEVIEEKIVHLVMATSTLSEGVNLPFETVLIPNLQRWGVNENSQINFSPSEFKNLVGRAGRPGFGTEGRSLVFLPEQPTDEAERKIRNLYFSLIRNLQDRQTDTDGGAISPLATLITHLRDKWRELVQNGSDADFLIWLEQTAPITTQPNNQSEEGAIESLDSLDTVLLAAIVEIEQIAAREMEPNELEAELRRLWQRTYAYYASQNQAKLQEFFVHRGKALKSTIYPDYSDRKRLYKTSLPPRSGNQLLSLYRRIRDHLETGEDYQSRQEEQQFAYIRDAIQLIGEVNTFSIDDLKGRGRGAATSWEHILHWWLCHQRSSHQPRETQVSDWHNFVSKNFSYRFNWGLGSVVALAIDEACGEMTFEPSSLENWPIIGLPWIVFWMKELIVWGTLDPVAAYLLARIDGVTTRKQAEELSQGYYQSVSNLEPNDRLSAITIRNWAQQAFAKIELPPIQLRPSKQIPVNLLRDFSKSSEQTWRVIPVEIKDEIHWLDPAGFPLASCPKPENWQEKYLDRFDFKLNSISQIITSTYYLD